MSRAFNIIINQTFSNIHVLSCYNNSYLNFLNQSLCLWLLYGVLKKFTGYRLSDNLRLILLFYEKMSEFKVPIASYIFKLIVVFC